MVATMARLIAANGATLYSPAELFWIVKNGIKMTVMPLWRNHSDEELWATVAFLKKLSEQFVKHRVPQLSGSAL